MASDAVADCKRAGFDADQCGAFDRCVQMNSTRPPPIQICQPNELGGFDCQGSTMSDPFHVTGANNPYTDAEQYCYAQMGSPPYPSLPPEDPPLPPEEPPFDPYKCHCPAHNISPTLLFLESHPMMVFFSSALVTGIILLSLSR